MENIGARIKMLRDALGNNGKKISQTEFGKRVGLSQNAVANVENEKNGISEAVIISIVREFHVNETWLRTGKGEMFLPVTRDAEIAEFIGKTVSGSDEFKKRLVWALCRLTEDEWEVLASIYEKMENPDA